MSSVDALRMNNQEVPKLIKKKVGIVSAEWHTDIVEELVKGCQETLEKAGLTKTDIFQIKAPGTFELPQVANWLDKKHQLDAIICLGCVIKGETDHDVYINQSVSAALMQLGLARSKPYVFGVLTVNNIQQAEDRAGGRHGNKGVEAALAAIKLLNTYAGLFEDRKKIGFV